MSNLPTIYSTEKDQWLEAARMAWSGGLLPKFVNKPEMCLYLMYRGVKSGIDPFIAAEQSVLINGKLTYSIQIIKALLIKSGVKWKEKECSDKQCVISFQRDGWEEHTEIYTLDDAKAQGLLGKDTFRNYPKLMMRANCIRRAASMIAPDVLMGLDGSEVDIVEEHRPLPPLAQEEPKTVKKREVKPATTNALPAAEPTQDPIVEVIEQPVAPVINPDAEPFENAKVEHRKLLIQARTELGIDIRKYNLNSAEITAKAEQLRVPADVEALKVFLQGFNL